LSLAPGARNLITDVAGLAVGNAAEARLRSGVTVVLADPEAVAAVDVRGGGPGTRETDLLEPSNMVQAVQGICLSGGSAFGLDAATGVMTWLAERDRGFRIGPRVVPLVPSAILYDLENGGDKDWGTRLPYQSLARAAGAAAGQDFQLGTAGAGYGAKAGGIKGGLGSASTLDREGLQVGALVAVNARGAVTLPDQPQFWAWPLEQGAEFGGLAPPTRRAPLDPDLARGAPLGASTTIAVVATNAVLTKAEARHVAVMAQDGLARAIRPVHTPFDGDTVFCLATGRLEVPGPRPRTVARVGSLAADTLARAVARGVYLAAGWDGLPAWRDLWG
jgi:L-aminopeptidase/D-esterase-like protein